MRIIPAIDIIEGKCVRLTKGEYSTKKIYNENPLEVAKQFEDNGIQFLHLVDLDGAKSKNIVNHKILEQIATKTSLKIDFGGGLKSDQDLEIAFSSGASQITGGSIAVKNPETFINWIEKYGAEKIILGADCKDRKIATNGWLQTSLADVVDFIIDYEEKGVKNVICTDVAKDGMLQGTSNVLYKEIIKITAINLIASGGVSSIRDLQLLKEIGCEGAILGKAIYEGKIPLKELQKLC
ncbi:1-(5-phosphoribosyl)-5-[(5-phosphoribosylamino)methylideneamino] imidazole-4-carboxamide isomerase [Tenacibaculum adriaticum]|uniref:1-(5-phosphoribosyl)-5-[(5-phosphoribosylamino)methylideneamino] imidazole-4-carboxamide isomerase n=1 Tax=Tenacibaculum adriaticum TaxID=413713 RepID=A0A5S5DSN8_9FLAO|nr:1-(5-phosphoribosyl)-5-[(5-phosphoribosylamino)methylideneamino]imidazole-4-carboxamide isomerase [Tenacibaculum adriaticum]TYP98897.1 1-(5-phosphoribosyl)-5-[(5-phosphoribosylamino)methylideneamino] imidazole-4-carboxamide isomerase [Tenacibaculum adriaticum]